MSIIPKTTVSISNKSKKMILGEIGQRVDIRFAMANTSIAKKKVVRISPYMKCRDFFNELIAAENANIPSSRQYGFSWDLNNRIDRRRTHVLVKVGDDVTGKMLIAGIKELRKYEKEAGIGSTRVYKLRAKNTYLYSSPRQWQAVGTMFALYTWIIRKNCYGGYLLGTDRGIKNMVEQEDAKQKNGMSTIGMMLKNTKAIFGKGIWYTGSKIPPMTEDSTKLYSYSYHCEFGALAFFARCITSNDVWSSNYRKLRDGKNV